MTDQWQFFPCSMGDDQAFIFVDEGAHKTISDAPELLARIRLTYKDPHPNGLPKDSEFEIVSNLEDKIQSYSTKNGDWYVGRVTVSGYRFFYIYSSLSEKLWDEFISKLCSESDYEIMVSFRDDPDHKGYWDELYPTADDWQVIGDLRVIENLEKDGDDGSMPRKIDHWTYFLSKNSAQPFIDWAIQNSYVHEQEHSHVTDDDKYCVRLSHNGTVKLGDISSHTIALRRKATELDGEYDGWETEIIKN
ncbi:DUF695 domain-containing protein [uncultured Desulfosarcina sp.]|uniref:DUF695 domain-containing protein n=1 Tax=uncultured Desulfosarcina sp. TaxID=218289 RepID=UPI0029C964AC|nr:DUF695 domain-containing protein [uncultured Desulfosarcina sp.]